jgi:hypothetical protein
VAPHEIAAHAVEELIAAEIREKLPAEQWPKLERMPAIADVRRNLITVTRKDKNPAGMIELGHELRHLELHRLLASIPPGSRPAPARKQVASGNPR